MKTILDVPVAPASLEEDQLRRDVEHLSERIGPRNVRRYAALREAEEFVFQSFAEAGYVPFLQSYRTGDRTYANVLAELPGGDLRRETVLVGAHYDTHKGSPGADDNASGVAVLLWLARRLASCEPSRTLRFAAFVNEEWPFTRGAAMGSRVCAAGCAERGERVAGMISLESLGRFSVRPGSQRLSLGGLLLPRRGDFLAAVSDRASAAFRDEALGLLGRGPVPVRPLTLSMRLPGARGSDHWSFRREGYPAFMITDTGPLRSRDHHRRSDTAEKLDFPRLAAAAASIEAMVRGLARPPAWRVGRA